MTDFTGPEKRQLDSERRGPHRDMVEIVSSIRIMRRDLACVRTEMEQYVPLLKRLMASEVDAETIKRDVIRHLMIGGTWSMVIGIVASGWYWVQHHLGSGN